MAINFIPNDPRATCVKLRKQTAHRERGTSLARFHYNAHKPAALYQPGTADFLFWQTREAALRAVAQFESARGAKTTSWARSSNRKLLDLEPDAGTDLNAYYDGQSLNFFHYTTAGVTTYSGASTDVVAHETGHALLDSIHPELWSSSYIETNAFHEAFADCNAILTALADVQTSQAVAASIRLHNCVETTAEDLSAAVKRALGASHPAAKPRRAKNTYQWKLPTTLPASGGPDVLTSEPHSFARVFTGCFWDTFLKILGTGKSATAIRAAARTTARILIAAAHQAPETTRFFQSVGRAMILVDQQRYAGAHRGAIDDAFAAHNIALGSAGMLAPLATIAGRAPALGQPGQPAVVSAAGLADLRQRLGSPKGARITAQTTEIGGERAVRLLHHREVPLRDVDRRLRGVVAIVPESILVGAADKRAAILGALPESQATTDEVHAFVRTILERDRIAFQGTGKGPLGSRRAKDQRERWPTHVVRTEGGRRVLRRVRYACGAD